ncbi:MAG: HAMP domain-containing sensor histidine kinase [Acidimicrobiales bacterium]
MTFRSRVITATVVAAALAVVLACFASFLTTRNALFNAVDQSLLQTSQGPSSLHADDSHVTGSYTELVLANGQTVPTAGVPIDSVIRSYAKGKSGHLLRTIQIGNQSYRELIVGLPAGSVVSCSTGLCQVATTSAQLFVVNVTGQENELRSLVRTLLVVAASGLLLALAMGWLLARAALRPLEDVTDEIETITETNDMRHRLEEGDADELGRLRRVFNRLLSSVESSQTLQRQLVLDASHELRTPLTSLRTNAQVLSRANELSPDDLIQLTNDMVTQVDELASLVTDLGELARGERSEGAVVSLRLDECVDECVDTARTYARIKDITIESHVEPSTIEGRRDRLVRAISNLLTNAVKFTPRGGQITVTSSAGTVTVSDSGPGISDDDIPFVFDRFWRSASSRALPGSGLGLSIVAQVIAEFHGDVRVDRDPVLGGARFTLTIPQADQTSNP